MIITILRNYQKDKKVKNKIIIKKSIINFQCFINKINLDFLLYEALLN